MIEFVDGNRIGLLANGAQYFPALEAAFEEARHEIYLETYIFEDDTAGRIIAGALAGAARRGVATHVMVDGFGSKGLSAEFTGELEAAGVRLLVYRPDISPWNVRPTRLRRLHRKIAVVDARVAFVGGINVIDDMDTPGHTPPRFDYAVRFEGPLVDSVHAAVRRLWSLVQATQLKADWLQVAEPAPAPAPPPVLPGSQRAAFVVRDNVLHRSDIEQAYLSAIEQARSEILIANAYFFPGASFRRALMDAAGRGVRVVLLLQARVEYVLLHYASRALYGAFLDAGIEIHEYHKSFMHAKVAVIDGHWATVGSSNIDPFSLLLAREANVVIDDAAFAGALRASLVAAMAEGARQLAREGWRREPHRVRIAAWMSYGLARVLTGVFAYGRAEEGPG
jgi:cardiolipin synthase A/B